MPAPELGAGKLVGMSLPGAGPLAGVLFWLIFPALSVAAIILAIMSLANNLDQRAGSVAGKFTVTDRSCRQHICQVSGDFVSDNGDYVQFSVPGDTRWELNSTHQAFFAVGIGEVDADAQEWDPTPAVLSLAGATTYLGVVGGLAVIAIRRRTEQDDLNRTLHPIG